MKHFINYRAHLPEITFLAEEEVTVLPPPPQTMAAMPYPLYPGPKFSRQDLEVLASGKISTQFGEWFRPLDDYPHLIRMPEPPLLLADRVLGIEAKPASLGKGTLWTETDVKEDSWYLHHRRMPCGIMIEAGQADLLLISWLGLDVHNKGERVYRLLGCELTFYHQLPKPGDTLRFDIHVDGHAIQGKIRLFFFHYDCHINQQLRMKVRHGQAGFFTYEELANSRGVLWDAATEAYDHSLPTEAPVVSYLHSHFSVAQMNAYAQGDLYNCFGQGFEYLQTHTRTPAANGQLFFIHHITDFDIKGGSWQRGYLRAVQKISPSDWFFNGHFKDDPCMPGTLMLEAGLQVMSIYMTALGCTLHRDGWRFEPLPEKTYKLTCRGQVTPSSQEVVYEIFVSGFTLKPRPILHADLLGSVDGLKAFHTKISLQLVPDWPLPERKHLPFLYDEASLLACALGKPSEAFGEMYEPFDKGLPVARLPAPPYHFISRILSIDAEKNSVRAGGKLSVILDIDPNAWYFRQNSHPVLPFCVLLEAGLQPCGWLASFLGCALTSEEALYYRNLDGTGTLTGEITPQDTQLKTHIECLSISRLSQTIIIAFKVNCTNAQNDPIYSMQTVFGFFPKAAFEKQEGLPPSESEMAVIHKTSDFHINLSHTEQSFPSLSYLPHNKLLMLDAITGYWPAAGSKKLGMMRAEKTVKPAEWFFKAHFFQDPVQPGSLGIEAMIQLIQCYMIHKKYFLAFKRPYFKPLTLDHAISWKYRGQVVPANRLIHILIDIVAETPPTADTPTATVIADASLWVDSKRIYEAKLLGVTMAEI